MSLLVTGGAGFIGANFILDWMRESDEPVVNLDKLTYAGNLHNLESVAQDRRLIFYKGDIGDTILVKEILNRHKPRAIVNFAAESHVDRSIQEPETFIETNVLSTFRLLDASLGFWKALGEDEQKSFRFCHVSTDEVYGSLGANDSAFREQSQYQPNSPYSASKAASDHLVRAYHHTYGLPVLTTNCSNNYGPFQFPEKLIPLMIHRALTGGKMPVYGDGKNIRDWLYVTDHCAAIREVVARGRPGETYNIGGRNEKTNLDVVHTLCNILDHDFPKKDGGSYREQIVYVTDRPGHDRRYAIDATKIYNELGWRPKETFETGIALTIQWYVDNHEWMTNVTSGAYREWVGKQYSL